VITSKLPLVLRNLVSHADSLLDHDNICISTLFSGILASVNQTREKRTSTGQRVTRLLSVRDLQRPMIACKHPPIIISLGGALLGNTYTAPRFSRYHEPLPPPADQGPMTSRGTTTDTTRRQPTAGFNKDDKDKDEGEDTLF